MTLVLLGPHGAGKTSLGLALARRLGCPFHAELGRALAEDPAWRRPGGTAAEAAEAFDRELFARELERDLAWGDRPRVVETWHPGNLAYAARRSPVQALGWLGALGAACRARRALVLPLDAPRAVLARRQSEPGDLDFFVEVGRASWAWAEALGLPSLPPQDSASAPPEALADQVLARFGPALRLHLTPHGD